MQGHGSTCDCTYSVLLDIALCICLVPCVSAWRGILLRLTPPHMSWVPLLVWGTQIYHCLRCTVYPPSPARDSSPLFFNEAEAGSSVSSAKKIFFLGAPAIFLMAFFFCQLSDTVCRVVACVGCQRFFAGFGGPERTPRHQRVQESEAEGYIVILQTLGTPTSLSVPSPPATPPASAFSRPWLGGNSGKDTEGRIAEQNCPPPQHLQRFSCGCL